MRKRTIKYISDKLLWLIAMLMPLIYCLVVNLHFTEANDPIYLSDIFVESAYGFGMLQNNMILEVINGMFGSAGVMPLWSNDSYIPYFITYLCTIVLVQLVFDIIMFIPKLAHKYLHAWTQDEE